jgi:hypothetical protein
MCSAAETLLAMSFNPQHKSFSSASPNHLCNQLFCSSFLQLYRFGIFVVGEQFQRLFDQLTRRHIQPIFRRNMLPSSSGSSGVWLSSPTFHPLILFSYLNFIFPRLLDLPSGRFPQYFITKRKRFDMPNRISNTFNSRRVFVPAELS